MNRLLSSLFLAFAAGLAFAEDVGLKPEAAGIDQVGEDRPPPPPPVPPPHLPHHVALSTRICTEKHGATEIVGGVRSSIVDLTAGFVGDGRKTFFSQFHMDLVTHCNFIFYPLPPFDNIAVKVDYYRNICDNSLTFALVDNDTISNVGKGKPFFAGMQRQSHLLNNFEGRKRGCASVVKDFRVPLSARQDQKAGSLVELHCRTLRLTPFQ